MGRRNRGFVTATATVDPGVSTKAFSVDYATSDGSAIAALDYAPTKGTLTFGLGKPTVQTVSLPILDDGLAENDETIRLTLSNPTSGVLLGVHNAADR